MNRRNRTLLVLVVAVGLASLATYGVFRTIKSIPVRQVEVATKHVVVAAENLPLGTRVSKEQLKVVGWPAATPVEGSFASVDEVVGRGLIQPVQANEPLTETKLAAEGGWRGPRALDPAWHAGAVSQDQRRDRCGRIHGAGAGSTSWSW